MIADGYSLIHKGHRARIRDKFARFGADVFSSHELLELLLFYMIPMRDTNPISHMLLSRFGTIGGVLSAGKDELMQVDGVGSATADALLSFANSLDLSYLRPMSKIIQFSKYETVGKFFTEKYRGATSEYVSAALLDNDLRLIRYIKVFDGKFLSPSLKARSIIVPAIQHRASCVLLAHNHVRRSAVASIEETRVSQILRSELAAANVTCRVHIIVSGKFYSDVSSPVSIREVKDDPDEEPTVSGPSPEEVTDRLASLLSLSSDDEKSRTAAKGLLEKYGDLSRIMSAPVHELEDADGMDLSAAILIKLVSAVNSRINTELYDNTTPYTKYDLADYLYGKYIGAGNEMLYMVLFREDNTMIDCVKISEGSLNFAPVLPRKMLETAISRKAARVLIAHNHPTGSASPSEEDARTTNSLQKMFNDVGIDFIDHVIISPERYVFLCDGFDSGGG